MNESDYERLLRIQTAGMREWQYQSSHYNRYEATPYSALQKLFELYDWKATNRMVDFGCGKGRFPFYVHYFYNISVTGIEMNGQLYQESMENLMKYMEKAKPTRASIRFECCLAEEYKIDSQEDCFYFFNPFSTPIFQKVVHNILVSLEEVERTVDIILYYPTPEYLQFLEEATAFTLWREIRIPELYEQNHNERFMIYRYEI
ncbi:methyltransferase [Bacillus sp. N3536]|nr:methyltransferase [Bacillus sp. N3536]